MLRSHSAALLLALAGGLSQLAATPAPYRGVPAPDGVQHGASLSVTCAACHGPRGNSISLTFPNLAGQNYNYLLKELEDFRGGRRHATPMTAFMNTIPPAPGDRNLMDLAAYFAAQALNRSIGANATEPKPGKAVAAAGYRLYAGGDSTEKVPACAACHAPGGTGNAPMAIPALAGQHAQYVENELRRFAAGKRDNSPQHVMAIIATRLSSKQIEAVAEYVQELTPKLMSGIGSLSYAAYVKALSHQPVPGIAASDLSTANSSPSGHSQ
ncbi:MAG: c-type cytochrome [Steroidobacteraceae bacterium]